ncbi:MAG: hypothetical protein U0Z26_07960 [Anaerolineales bacterium]
MRQLIACHGNIWVHSIPGRPALDVGFGALYLIAVILQPVSATDIEKMFYSLLAVPLLQMPSILSLLSLKKPIVESYWWSAGACLFIGESG